MAASVCCCFSWWRDGGAGHIPLKEMPAVHLDTQRMGTDVVIVKNGRRICGTGGCLANAPLHQNKSYFEFKIQSTGYMHSVGRRIHYSCYSYIYGHYSHRYSVHVLILTLRNTENKLLVPVSCVLCIPVLQGRRIGITYDHVELNVYLNGKNMHCPASGIRGTVYPVVYVDDSAILDCQFSEFYHTPPPGFEKILFEQQIF
ncbi:SPRY7 protein, partial [Uria aalge]|nr:SPRY7 protein [Uria aalge]